MPNTEISKLQAIQNHAAKLIFRKKKFDSVTPIMMELHWLPVKERIVYKTACLVYKSINGSAPVYLRDLIEVYRPARHLRSASDSSKLIEPVCEYKRFGERAFSCFAPHVWNELPYDVRNAPSIDTFKSRLKTYLFTRAF